MDAIENLMTRRSVRRFTDRRISLEDLETITNAARMAPSGMNRQLWKFTVLKNKELMDGSWRTGFPTLWEEIINIIFMGRTH